ncbi:MAG: hypothetical protein GAK29_02512 [Acinetobacter bereziniae]|uniref:Thioredoxin n=1 Tax=Acinetobacter bereziniae TaxID=106648 RepID=A0A833PDG6_ACIBZ|nr:MAG: hypothetical protein GAK29_02512 [Acinetobacter bereziniae]
MDCNEVVSFVEELVNRYEKYSLNILNLNFNTLTEKSKVNNSLKLYQMGSVPDFFIKKGEVVARKIRPSKFEVEQMLRINF